MKNYLIILVLIISILVFSCTKSDTSAGQQKIESTVPAAKADSGKADSMVTDIQKSSEDLKKQADEVQKAVDDLLK